jgi:hypothetical protein
VAKVMPARAAAPARALAGPCVPPLRPWRLVAARDGREQPLRVLLARLREDLLRARPAPPPWPSFITSTSSLMKRTTARSWLMKT